MYELKTETFSGPLEKLLELIEAHEMDVSAVSMAQVTDDFLKYLETLRGKKPEDAAIAADGERVATAFEIDLRILADFISVASKLIFLKSKYLLPGLALTDEEEADIKDLEGRFTFGNQRYCSSQGLTPDELLGKTDFDLFPAELAAKYVRDDREVIRSGGVFETVRLTGFGEYFELVSSGCWQVFSTTRTFISARRST